MENGCKNENDMITVLESVSNYIICPYVKKTNYYMECHSVFFFFFFGLISNCVSACMSKNNFRENYFILQGGLFDDVSKS